MSDPQLPPPSLAGDVRAGALVALLALPLCLGIAVASGFPAASGIVSAVVGGLLVSALGSARVTIKGPAAGLIAVLIAAVAALGVRGALAAFLAAGVIQLVLGMLGAARLMRFVPPAVVHGMLAAIGLVIAVKQLPVLLAIPVDGHAGVGEVLAATMRQAGESYLPALAVGLVTLAGLVALAWLAKRHPNLAQLPGPLIAVGTATVLALILALPGTSPSGAALLPELPRRASEWILLPDLRALAQPLTWYHVIIIAAVGSLESLLTVRAVDEITGTRSDLDRDLRAIGIGNAAAACIGGLPMISEVVRSTANVHYGARSPRSNAVHGLVLLAAVALLPGVLARIPLAALAAVLLFVAGKLAAPGRFARAYRLGSDQLLAFAATLIGALAVDLLVGIALGVAVQIAVHGYYGARARDMMRAHFEIRDDEQSWRVELRGALTFSNLWQLQQALEARPPKRAATVDLSATQLVDHTAMATLAQLESSHDVKVVGLEKHRGLSEHQLSTRARKDAGARGRLS